MKKNCVAVLGIVVFMFACVGTMYSVTLDKAKQATEFQNALTDKATFTDVQSAFNNVSDDIVIELMKSKQNNFFDMGFTNILKKLNSDSKWNPINQRIANLALKANDQVVIGKFVSVIAKEIGTKGSRWVLFALLDPKYEQILLQVLDKNDILPFYQVSSTVVDAPYTPRFIDLVSLAYLKNPAMKNIYEALQAKFQDGDKLYQFKLLPIVIEGLGLGDAGFKEKTEYTLDGIMKLIQEKDLKKTQLEVGFIQKVPNPVDQLGTALHDIAQRA
jgi:hypothetical protein